MKLSRVNKAICIVLYMLLASALMKFQMSKLIQPIPLMSVVIGIIILTLSQVKKGQKLQEIISNAGWNAFLSGLLTSILSMLSLIVPETGIRLTIESLSEQLVPLLYGGFLNVFFDFIGMESKRDMPQQNKENEMYIFDGELLTESTYQKQKIHAILTVHGFTIRECHVATKIINNRPNKEIAEELYISESTVKKHIQNMFKKCGASNRQEFQQIFIGWYKENT